MHAMLAPLCVCVSAGAEVIELQAPPLHGFSSPGGELAVPLAVTMVFCCVEGGAARVHRRPEVARLLHNTLSRLMQVSCARVHKHQHGTMEC
jgi:hypothetical protein